MEQEVKEKTRIHTVYKTSDGTRVPSVTTILGILNKPALLEWAWRCGCDGLDYKAVRDQAADIGTLAHYLIMCHLQGIEPDTPQWSPADVDRAENCVLSYLEWERGKDLKPLLIEQQLVSEEDKFGGTVDCVAELNGEIVLVDYKTGKAIYPEMFAQLAAYRHLLAGVVTVKSARILRIGRDENEGFEERLVTSDQLDKQWELFQHCLAIYNLQKEAKKL